MGSGTCRWEGTRIERIGRNMSVIQLVSLLIGEFLQWLERLLSVCRCHLRPPVVSQWR